MGPLARSPKRWLCALQDPFPGLGGAGRTRHQLPRPRPARASPGRRAPPPHGAPRGSYLWVSCRQPPSLLRLLPAPVAPASVRDLCCRRRRCASRRDGSLGGRGAGLGLPPPPPALALPGLPEPLGAGGGGGPTPGRAPPRRRPRARHLRSRARRRRRGRREGSWAERSGGARRPRGKGPGAGGSGKGPAAASPTNGKPARLHLSGRRVPEALSHPRAGPGRPSPGLDGGPRPG